MIFGLRRGLAAMICLALGSFSTTQALEKHIVIPETVEAIDLNTGGPYYAPPVPQGHYTKDTYGHIAGTVHGKLAHLKGAAAHLVKTICSMCGGSGQCAGCGTGAATGAMGTCNSCGGKGFLMSPAGANSGHIHGTTANGSHAGHVHGTPVVTNGPTYVGNGAGVPVVASNGIAAGANGYGNGYGQTAGAGHASHSGAYGGHGVATAQAGPSSQSAPYVAACANGGCGGSACGDPACHGLFGGKGRFGVKGASGAGAGCGTPGCTSPGCGLGGLMAGHNGYGHGAGNGFGSGAGCGNPGCTSPGCGNGAGLGHGMGHPAGQCGNPGCDICGAAKGLLSKLHGMLYAPFAKHHAPKWFMGPGGPVPLTPGYVQWVNPIRSPRDYFAFPPYLDQAMEPGYASMPKSTAGFATDRATTTTDFVAPKPAATRTAPVPPPAPRTEATREVETFQPRATSRSTTVPPPAPAPNSDDNN